MGKDMSDWGPIREQAQSPAYETIHKGVDPASTYAVIRGEVQARLEEIARQLEALREWAWVDARLTEDHRAEIMLATEAIGRFHSFLNDPGPAIQSARHG